MHYASRFTNQVPRDPSVAGLWSMPDRKVREEGKTALAFCGVHLVACIHAKNEFALKNTLVGRSRPGDFCGSHCIMG